MRDVTTIKFAKLNENAVIPTGREEDLGLDFYAVQSKHDSLLHIPPHTVAKISTGIAMAMDDGYGMVLKERSSLGASGIAVRAGVVDSGYRGEIVVCLENTTNEPYILDLKNAVAQGVLIPNPKKVIEGYKVDELMEIKSERGVGGFGSTN